MCLLDGVRNVDNEGYIGELWMCLWDGVMSRG